MYSLKHLWVLFVAGNKNTVPFKKSIYSLALLEKRECRFEGENNKNRKIGFLFITVFSTHLILGSTNLRSISTSEWFFVKSSFFSLSNSSSLANLYTPIAPCTSPSLLYHAIIIAFFTSSVKADVMSFFMLSSVPRDSSINIWSWVHHIQICICAIEKSKSS